MKRFIALFVFSLFLASSAIAAGPKDYQVTGPVLDVKDDVVTVQKGQEKWEIARDKDTKINGELTKGSKVTIQYKMTATSIEVKDTAKSKTETKGKAESKAKTAGKTK